jgi:hypothetical protein
MNYKDRQHIKHVHADKTTVIQNRDNNYDMVFNCPIMCHLYMIGPTGNAV